MFYIYTLTALLFFLAHMILLFSAFAGRIFATARYLSSHFFLWCTGITLLVMTLLYSGKGKSAFLDYFGDGFKKALIPLFSLALSLTAHRLVKNFLIPLMRKRDNPGYGKDLFK